MVLNEHIHADAKAWLAKDLSRVESSLDGKAEAFFGKRVLLTGAAGFLGFNFLHFFTYLNAANPSGARVTVTAVDNFLRGRPRWIDAVAAADHQIIVRRFDATNPWPSEEAGFDFIIHGAS